MPTKTQSSVTDIPDDLREFFASVPTLTDEDKQFLTVESSKLERDREFATDYFKSRFVEDILQAMKEDGVNQSDLAAKWGRSRQYLNKILNQDRRVNFTAETMIDLALLLDRRLELHVLKMNAATHVLRCEPRSRLAPPVDFDEVSKKPSNILLFNENDYDPTTAPTTTTDGDIKLRA